MLVRQCPCPRYTHLQKKSSVSLKNNQYRGQVDGTLARLYLLDEFIVRRVRMLYLVEEIMMVIQWKTERVHVPSS